LYKLNISVSGLYDLDLIKDLKLFHEDVQLGEIDKIDVNGKIYFDLSEYQLPAGQNKFSLFFNNGSSLKTGEALNFSIEKQEDIYLIKDGHIFRPQADFPVASGLISIANQGQIFASNIYVVNDFLINSDTPQQVASFDLSSIGEKIDLKKIKLSYQDLNSDEYQDLDFVLIHNNKPIAKATSNQGEIVFNLNKVIVLQDLQREQFDLHALSMPEGSYQFSIKDVQGLGALSGLYISLADGISLSRVEALPYFIQMQVGDLDSKLSAGWNKIYDLNIKSKGKDKLYLNKLTLQVDKQNLDIDEVEILKNNQIYIANVVLKDNRLIIKMDSTSPLEITSDNTEIIILANFSNVGKKAKIESFVISDKQAMGDDLADGNIIWSDGDKYYNAYKIPYLPLEPSILAN